jgi:ATP-dependent Clp protease ATP-binding subunit ClpB
MNINRLTEKAREALVEAQTHAEQRGNSQIEPEHLLLALVQQEGGVVPQVLQKLGVQPRALAVELESALDRLPKVQGQAQAYLSPSLNSIADGAEKEAANFKDEYTSTEHLLLAMIDTRGAPGVAALLKRHGITKDSVYQVLAAIRGGQRVTDQNPEGKYEALEKYGRDLTDMARRGSWTLSSAGSGYPWSSGAVAANEEQPGAHRGSGRGQDGHRGGAGPAHCSR